AAAAALTGHALGAGDIPRIKKLAKTIAGIEVFLMLVSGTLLFIFAPAMAGLFTKDLTVIALSSTVLRMVACSEPFYGVSIAFEGMLQGAGRTVMPFAFNIIGMWGIRILGTFIFTQVVGLGLIAAWACMIAHNICLFAMFTIYFTRVKWKYAAQLLADNYHLNYQF
ncbi:MAG: MATE family efflux transporter, partial [Lachnospiraceae bacterium]|nr:MATE family efflux transporter [Lachnospiraceae bacterium]